MVGSYFDSDFLRPCVWLSALVRTRTWNGSGKGTDDRVKVSVCVCEYDFCWRLSNFRLYCMFYGLVRVLRGLQDTPKFVTHRRPPVIRSPHFLYHYSLTVYSEKTKSDSSESTLDSSSSVFLVHWQTHTYRHKSLNTYIKVGAIVDFGATWPGSKYEPRTTY